MLKPEELGFWPPWVIITNLIIVIIGSIIMCAIPIAAIGSLRGWW